MLIFSVRGYTVLKDRSGIWLYRQRWSYEQFFLPAAVEAIIT